jgi:pimeloyl-ACP methyl ester carboxylesterase
MPQILVDGIPVSFEDVGSGPVLLLVHGFPLDHTMWREQIEYFSPSRRVLAPDLRGFGNSSPTEGTVTMRQFADDLAALLDTLRIAEPVDFCGLSMGGYIAWPFFQHYRDKVRSLILCDTRAAADNPEARENRLGLATKVLQCGPGFIAETMPDKLFAGSTRDSNPDLVREVQDVIRSGNGQGIAAASRGMAERPDVTSLLPTIDVPTLVIVGEEDPISTRDEMQGIARAIPGAEFVPVRDAGHMAPLEQPAIVNAAIDRFLARVD